MSKFDEKELAKRKKRMQEKWKDPEFREKVMKYKKKYWNNPENRKKHSENMKRVWDDKRDEKAEYIARCPHCGMWGKPFKMQREHFSNCPLHPDNK